MSPRGAGWAPEEKKFLLCLFSFWFVVFALILTFGKFEGVPCPKDAYCPPDPPVAATREQDDETSKAIGRAAILWMYFF